MIKFKDSRVETEWKYSSELSERVKKIAEIVAGFCQLNFGKDVVITHILRSQAEQDTFYANDAKYKEAPWKSVHQYGRGIDLRSRDFTPAEIERIVAFANMITYSKEKNTCVYHDVGQGKHIHLQARI
jgi:hypothetical protein